MQVAAHKKTREYKGRLHIAQVYKMCAAASPPRPAAAAAAAEEHCKHTAAHLVMRGEVNGPVLIPGNGALEVARVGKTVGT